MIAIAISVSCRLVLSWFVAASLMAQAAATSTTSPVAGVCVCPVGDVSDRTALATRADGSVWAWGYDADGETGTGNTSTTGCDCLQTPTQVVGPGGTGALSGITAIAAGGPHGLALANTGAVWSWGLNTSGQLGDGTTTSRSGPVQVQGLAGVTALAGGAGHSLAVKGDGTVWAWGANANGQLGDGTTTQRLVPVQMGGISGAAAVAGGQAHSLVLGADGTLWATGNDDFGQLGDGTRNQTATPVQVTNLGGMATLGAGYLFSRATAIRQWTTNYTYDHLGELVGTSGPAQQTASYTYDPAGRLTAVGPYTAASDADGNLTGITTNDATTNSYNGDGLRTGQTANGTTTTYLWDVNRSLPEVLSDGGRTYVYGPGLAYSVDASNNVAVYHTDGLGSVRALTDGSGNIIQTYRTDAFGNPVSLPGTQGAASQPFGFTGQQQDPTGLVYLRARYYAPALRRFVTDDLRAEPPERRCRHALSAPSRSHHRRRRGILPSLESVVTRTNSTEGEAHAGSRWRGRATPDPPRTRRKSLTHR